MAEEQQIHCKYCNSNFSNREYGLHRLSNAHVKKVKMEFDFSSVCLVCKHGLKDLKDVESHVQSDTHKMKLQAGLFSSSCTTINNCTCIQCAVSFHNCIALEVHRLMPLHRKEEKAYLYPKLNELLRQVSGLPGEELAMYVTSLCTICDVQHDSLDAYIMHLFTTAHIGRVRHSECSICSKAFIHAENRESHLVSSKHISALQKWNSSLKVGCGPANMLTKGGYPCMVCMIWCSSWPCFELHLLYAHHSDALRLSNKDCPRRLASMNFLPPTNTDENAGRRRCNASYAHSWKEWKGSVLKEHAWCHVCTLSLPNLDVVNGHLKDKHAEKEKIQAMLPKKHAAQHVIEYSESPTLFNCCSCSLSFKSALMLSAHVAGIEHHCRLANSLPNAHLICCANCGELIDKQDGEMDGKRLDITTSYMKSYQGLDVKPIATSDLSIPMASHNPYAVVPYVDMQDKPCVFNACHLKEERSPMACNTTGNASPSPLINAHSVKIEKDEEISQAHTDAAKGTIEGRWNGKSSACFDEGVLNTPASVLQNEDIKIPVVTAVALVPLGALQQSMHSTTNVVAEALLKSVQRFMQNLTKRKSETDDKQGEKKLCSEQIDALHSYTGTEKAEVSTTEDKSLWQQEAILTASASALPIPLPDANSWFPTQPAPAMLIRKGKQVIAMDSADVDVCGLACKVDDSKTSVDNQSVIKARECHSEKLDGHQALQATLMDMHSHDNEMASTMKEELGFKSREPPALIIELGTSLHCIKSEKHAVDNDDSLTISNNFKDADLWWVLSDSDDGESSHKQKSK